METLPLPGMERAAVEPASPSRRARALAARLPAGLRLGTSSWSFPGWAGLVYAHRYPRAALARDGLAAYARHPLLGAAGVDRGFYQALDEDTLARYVRAVPSDFRFVVKAHEHTTWARFPRHPRFGASAGRDNPRFLDAEYAMRAVVAPILAALGEQLGALVFQFPPQPSGGAEGARRFVDRLHSMLRSLPRGPRYAIEIRTEAWLTASYAAALADADALHCFTVHPQMPDLRTQQTIAAATPADDVVVRWNLGHGRDYESARARYAPFDRSVDPDPGTRTQIAELALDALAHGREVSVLVNNKAEGSAPLSVEALAATIVERVAVTTTTSGPRDSVEPGPTGDDDAGNRSASSGDQDRRRSSDG